MFGNPNAESNQTPDFQFDPFSAKNTLTFGGTQPSLPTLSEMVDALTPPTGALPTKPTEARVVIQQAATKPVKPEETKTSFATMDIGALEETRLQLEKLIENKKYTKVYKDKVAQGLYLLDLVGDRVLVFLVDNPQPGLTIPFVLDTTEALGRVLQNPDMLINVQFASVDHLQQVLLSMYENVKSQCLDPIASWVEWLKA
jgi:hypothetical protein